MHFLSSRRAARSGASRVGTLGGLATAAALCGALSSAHAETTATVLDTSSDASVAGTERAYFDASMGETLRGQQLVVTAKSDRDLIFTEEKRLQSCQTAVCIERIGRLLGSRYVIHAEVGVRRDGPPPTDVDVKKEKNGRPHAPKTTPGDWKLKIDLFHVDIGASGSTVTADCQKCDTAAAGRALSELLQKALIEEAARPRGSLAVESKPPGALVFVDGTELGVTPFKRPSYSGKHRLVLRSAGFRSDQRDIEVPESQRLSLDIALVEGADAAEPAGLSDAKTPVYKKWWFWVAVGGAAVAVAGAVTAGAVVATQAPSQNGTPAMNHFVF